MSENGCTCGNLVYDSNIVGATGHMMNCPVYKILKLEGDVEGAKEYARLLQNDMRKVMAQRDTLSNRVKELEAQVAKLKSV